jgi:hypothetical protein
MERIDMIKQKMTKGKWLEDNGFSNNGISYLILGNSYPIKDDLKEAGFKFSNLLRWHGSDNTFNLPADCSYTAIDFNDFFVWDEEQRVAFMKEKARENLNLIFNPPMESASKYVGSVGDKLENLCCEVKNICGYDTVYGYRWVYNFIDENKNEYSWHSTVNKSLSAGMWLEISGTIKEHKEYRGIKNTVLTRCKIIKTL